MKLPILNLTTNQSSEREVSDAIFARDFNAALVHQVITAYLARGHTGTKAQKNRARVAGSGRKPWRQKGTGRSRAGTAKSPIWVGGGVTFAATPQKRWQRINKKMYRAALCVIFSELLRTQRLRVVQDFLVTEAKTKNVIALLQSLQMKTALLISEKTDENLWLSARNAHAVDVCEVANLNLAKLIHSQSVVMNEAAVAKIEAVL